MRTSLEIFLKCMALKRSFQKFAETLFLYFRNAHVYNFWCKLALVAPFMSVWSHFSHWLPVTIETRPHKAQQGNDMWPYMGAGSEAT